MIRKLLTLGLATALLTASAAATPAHAATGCSPLKKAAKGCQNEIKKCGLIFGSVVKGKAKMKAKKACKQYIVAQCKAGALSCAASPSGAFID
jgi:hypothetical protein